MEFYVREGFNLKKRRRRKKVNDISGNFNIKDIFVVCFALKAAAVFVFMSDDLMSPACWTMVQQAGDMCSSK